MARNGNQETFDGLRKVRPPISSGFDEVFGPEDAPQKGYVEDDRIELPNPRPIPIVPI